MKRIFPYVAILLLSAAVVFLLASQPNRSPEWEIGSLGDVANRVGVDPQSDGSYVLSDILLAILDEEEDATSHRIGDMESVAGRLGLIADDEQAPSVAEVFGAMLDRMDVEPIDPEMTICTIDVKSVTYSALSREVTIRAWCTPTSSAQLDIYTPDGQYIDEPGEVIDPAWTVWVGETGEVTWTIPIPLPARFGPGAEGRFVINLGLRSGRKCSYEGTYRMTR